MTWQEDKGLLAILLPGGSSLLAACLLEGFLCYLRIFKMASWTHGLETDLCVIPPENPSLFMGPTKPLSLRNLFFNCDLGTGSNVC